MSDYKPDSINYDALSECDEEARYARDENDEETLHAASKVKARLKAIPIMARTNARCDEEWEKARREYREANAGVGVIGPIYPFPFSHGYPTVNGPDPYPADADSGVTFRGRTAEESRNRYFEARNSAHSYFALTDDEVAELFGACERQGTLQERIDEILRKRNVS